MCQTQADLCRCTVHAFTTVLGEKVTEAPCESPTFTIAWHPKRYIIAYACDDKEKASYGSERDRGSVKIYGISKDP